MIRALTAVLPLLLIVLFSACYPSKSWFGYTLHAHSSTEEYRCRYLGIQSTFDGVVFHEPQLVDSQNPMFYGQQHGYIPGQAFSGSELTVTVECFDDDENLLGTTVYSGTIINVRQPSNITIYNFLPDYLDATDCVAPAVHDSGPELCATMEGFAPPVSPS